MIEIFLEFLFGLFSVSGAKKAGIKFTPAFTLILIIWLGALFTLTLVFG